MAEHWLKHRKATGSFALISLAFGFFFLNRGTITGNVVLNNQYPVNPLSLVGLLLVICAVILSGYSIRR